jgi:restriction system protein
VLANPPASLDTKYLLAIPAFRDFYRGGDDSEAVTAPAEVEPPSATPEEVVEAAYKAVHAALRADLLDRILQNSPSFFEQVIVELLVAMGYGGSHRNASEQLGKSGDGGVDGVINEDVLGLDRVYSKRNDTPREARSGGPRSRHSPEVWSASARQRAFS